jgi:hypothetical protein
MKTISTLNLQTMGRTATEPLIGEEVRENWTSMNSPRVPRVNDKVKEKKKER